MAAAELGGTDAQPYWSEGRELGGEAAIGAALDALRLSGAHAPYATFGRWLRSPFFARQSDEQFACARLDADLRTELRSQLPFQAAYRCGLKELLETRAPHSARALAAALGVIGGVRRATPGRWAHLWTRSLAELGWQPPTARTTLLGWQSTLDELARLTPIFGEISLDGALAELARLLERTTPVALPLCGVHVLRRVEDVGPGYDAVWVTGFTDSAWPQPPHGNPLLPIALQREHGMPYSSPRDADERSRRVLDRLVRRSRELVVSWPARVYDYETEPSPAIRSWPTLVRRRARRNDHRSRRCAPPRAKRLSTSLRRSPAAACQAGQERSAGRHAAPCGRSVRTDSARGSSSHSDLACRLACAVSRLTELRSDCSASPPRTCRSRPRRAAWHRASKARSRACSGVPAAISRPCTSSKPTSCNAYSPRCCARRCGARRFACARSNKNRSSPSGH